MKSSSWSRFFDATALGTHYFTVFLDELRAIALKLDTSLWNSVVFLTLEKVAPNCEPFEIFNETSDYSLKIRQKSADFRCERTLPPRNSTKYVPDLAERGETLTFAFIHENTGREMLRGEIPLDSWESRPVNPLGNGFFCKETLESGKKTLRFLDKSSENSLETAAKPNDLQGKSSVLLEIRLKYVGISLISNSRDGKSPYEIGYFLLENARLSAMETSEDGRDFAFCLENILLQNNSGFGDHFPVILQRNPRKSRENRGNSPENRENPWVLRVFARQTRRNSRNLLTFEDFRVEIAELKLCLEGAWKSLCAEFSQDLAKCTKVLQIPPNSAISWRNVAIVARNKDIYIRKLVISAIFLNISYKSSPLPTTSLKNLYKSLTNFENIEFSLPGVALTHCFDNKTALCGKLLFHFKENFTYDIVKVLGCIEILGNPVGLWKHISTGFRDFLEKPFEEGGKG